MVAYRQPVTRARIAAVRGVNVDGVVRTLVARGLIEEAGIDPDTGAPVPHHRAVPGAAGAELRMDELPSLGPLLPDIDSIDDV